MHNQPSAGCVAFRLQSGWTWKMLTIEVATGGRLIFSCDGQREDVRLPKSGDTNRLRKQLGDLFPDPGGPFLKKRDRVYIARFCIVPHRDLAALAALAARPCLEAGG